MHTLPHLHFALAVKPLDAANEILGQLFVIALPEEAFYRGYLQSRLDDEWPARWRVLGARVGPGWLVAAAIFAAGHLATIHAPARLAVFFPALLFGWLRARTGGIGASVVFHMLCNVYSQALGRGYGMY
jgi:membrane protease YdiL (CAAX protease family)